VGRSSDRCTAGVSSGDELVVERRRQSALHWQRQCRLTCWCALLPWCGVLRGAEVSDTSTYTAEGERLLGGQDARQRRGWLWCSAPADATFGLDVLEAGIFGRTAPGREGETLHRSCSLNPRGGACMKQDRLAVGGASRRRAEKAHGRKKPSEVSSGNPDSGGDVARGT